MANSVTLVRGVYAAAFAFTSNVAADDTVTIGDVTYTFKAVPSAAYEVDIGTDLDESITHLALAINATGVEGTDYGTGTLAHPDFTATADTTNGELDLAARCAGNCSNGVYLAATSPGANDISPAAAVTGSVAGATQGSGSLDDWFESLEDLNQINSEVLYQIHLATDAVD